MLLNTEIDSTDQKIMQELMIDARLTTAELGRRIDLSSPATAERIHRLENLKFIRGYRADIDLPALGFTITAFVRLRCEGPRYKPFLKFLPTLESVRECHHLTGDYTFLLKLVLSSMAELEELIEKLLPYGTSTSSLVLSTPLERKQLPRF